MGTFFRTINCCLISSALFTMLAPPAFGQMIKVPELPAEEGKLVKFWLKDVWDKGITNNDKSVQVFEAARPKNSYVNLAYAVNRLHHNRSIESLAAIEATQSQDPNNLDAIVFSIWLNVLRNDFDVALIEMQAFADAVKRSKIDRDGLDVAYRRIGRLLGYLQGPVAGRCNPEILTRTVTRINDGLENRQKKLITDSSDGVLARYDELLRDLNQQVHDSIKKNEASNEASKKALKNQSNALAAQTDQIQQQRDDIQIEAEQKISAAAQQLPALEAELQTVIAEIDAIGSQILYRRSAVFYGLNNSQGNFLAQDFNRFQLQQSYLALSTLRANANSIANAIAIEQNRINQISNAYNAEIRKLDRDIKKSANLQRRNTNKLVKIAAGPAPDAGKVAALNNRISALSIYDPLPLEQFRADLLRQVP